MWVTQIGTFVHPINMDEPIKAVAGGVANKDINMPRYVHIAVILLPAS
jgi:hypothetical protein